MEMTIQWPHPSENTNHMFNRSWSFPESTTLFFVTRMFSHPRTITIVCPDLPDWHIDRGEEPVIAWNYRGATNRGRKWDGDRCCIPETHTNSNSAGFSQIIHAIFVNIILRIELITIFFMEIWPVVTGGVDLPSFFILKMVVVNGTMIAHSATRGKPTWELLMSKSF